MRDDPGTPIAVGEVLAGALAAIGGPDGGAGRPATCRDCGDAALWHRTVHGRWILMQPGSVPYHLVPAAGRYRIGSDGTAVHLGAAAPTDDCRVTHFDICPARPAPRHPYLLHLWQHAAARCGRS
ncbi:DUF6083 domain-containing protein [Streptomyces sp. NPDC054838]